MTKALFLKQLPNVLSCSRIILSPLLLLTLHSTMGFLLLYTICGLTDFADGFIARKYKIATSLGARLDSFADMIFCVIILYLIYSQIQIKMTLFLPVILFIFVLRVINMIITRIRFKEWGIIHTIANKATGFALFLILPVSFLFHWNSPNFMIAVVLLALFSSLEEMAILLIFTNYDVNRKSLLRCRKGCFFSRYTERVLNKK